ncbi:MAG: adenosylcobalamin-dependent ribonucleoside-diphosphate reductase [Rhizobium sp.]|nr:MAG: adenosylcobalamin-dependent ribonucleoside-diphosphate reductase [Rhizobium sp.]
MADGHIERSSTLIQLQEASARIIGDKRLLPGETLDGMRLRVATALAKIEAKPDQWIERFYEALLYAFPGGRIAANIGAEGFKPNVSTINCTVSRTIEDSMEGIADANKDAMLTLKAGCGIGYDFSTIRPRGAFVHGAGAYTSGVLPFMDIFDMSCKTVSSAGGRRGAQMGVLDIGHPDIMDFILAKRETGRLRNFNLSSLITDEFIDAVREGKEWKLAYPAFPKDIEAGCEIVYRRWPAHDERYTLNDRGETACKVYKTLSATDLFGLIMHSTYTFNDPGFVLVSRMNRMNTLWFAEFIRATNPCGEQPLPPFGACLLGSLNLAAFVRNPFTDKASFDQAKYRQIVGVFSRMLDNVVEVNGLPLPQQREEIFSKRRHGMGFFGLGSALTMLGKQYGSAEGVNFTSQVSQMLAVESWRSALELAKEKGPAPILTQEFELTPAHLADRPELIRDGYKLGDKVPGRILHARYSRYMQQIATVEPELVNQLAEVGARYTHATSIAPTGTMAAGEGNNASNGIEPSFNHFYIRNMIVPGKKTKEALPCYSYELWAYKQLVDPSIDPTVPGWKEKLPACFKATADDIAPRQHIEMQAAAQVWIDSAISKTVNVPTDTPFEEFKNIYMYAFEKGLKGCTTYRFNPEVSTGVLARPEDMASTVYEFKLADGTDVRLRGDEMVEYDGNVSTAANLFDALKEGTYGKH